MNDGSSRRRHLERPSEVAGYAAQRSTHARAAPAFALQGRRLWRPGVAAPYHRQDSVAAHDFATAKTDTDEQATLQRTRKKPSASERQRSADRAR